jgi:hypothetical protein
MDELAAVNEKRVVFQAEWQFRQIMTAVSFFPSMSQPQWGQNLAFFVTGCPQAGQGISPDWAV